MCCCVRVQDCQESSAATRAKTREDKIISRESYSIMQLQELGMVPVRATIYVVKLPFLFIWRVIYILYSYLYAVFATILR